MLVAPGVVLIGTGDGTIFGLDDDIGSGGFWVAAFGTELAGEVGFIFVSADALAKWDRAGPWEWTD